MPNAIPPVIAVLRHVPDPRRKRGVRHPFAALLALSYAAILCGARWYGAIAEWGRNCDPAFLRALGFRRDDAPCAATFFQAFRKLDRERFEAVLAALPTAEGEEEALALLGIPQTI